jgi:hypothetical protein
VQSSPARYPALPPALPTRSATFLPSVLLATLVSGGILEERLSGGSANVGIVVNALMTIMAILTLGLIERGGVRSVRVLVLQVAGAAVGIAAVHLALRFGWIPGAAWLVERPAQLMNDVVAVAATLAVAWACARGLSSRILLAVLVLLTAYRATARLWHLDAPPSAFHVTVQDLVVAQLVAVALALGIYSGLRSMRGDAR